MRESEKKAFKKISTTTLTINGHSFNENDFVDFVDGSIKTLSGIVPVLESVDTLVHNQLVNNQNDDFVRTVFKDIAALLPNTIDSVLKKHIDKFSLSKKQVKNLKRFLKKSDIKITLKGIRFKKKLAKEGLTKKEQDYLDGILDEMKKNRKTK